MTPRVLGARDLRVSPLCLGTMAFGGATHDTRVCHAMLDRALAIGINFFDTAPLYGNGASERAIGDWIESRGVRDAVVVATKFRFGVPPLPGPRGARRAIARACEESLDRLKMTHIDLYQIHQQDNGTPEEEILEALDGLVRQGKVRWIGVCNYAVHRLVDSLWTSTTRRLARYVALQVQYSLAVRDVEREHLPACTAHGIGVIAWSPLAGGFLAGAHARLAPPATGTRMATQPRAFARLASDRNWDLIETLRRIARGLGATPAQVALAWLMHRPGVCSVAFGARTLAQLDENAAAARLALSDAQTAALDAASAPERGYPYDMISAAQQCATEGRGP